MATINIDTKFCDNTGRARGVRIEIQDSRMQKGQGSNVRIAKDQWP